MSDPGPGSPRDLRVLVVDDHPIFRMGMAAAINDMEGVVLAGEAEAASDVEEMVASTKPDIVLLDLHLPDGSGLDVNRRLRERFPDVHVIVLTMSEVFSGVVSAMRDGASGYIIKGAGSDRIEQALHTVAAGNAVLSPELALSLAELANSRAAPDDASPFPGLSARELEVLGLVAAGLNNQAIAQRLYLNPKTVRNHVSNVLTKIHAQDRSEAIVLARQAGMGIGDLSL
jgi:DNA-binding NarL/FixJ family response regulator